MFPVWAKIAIVAAGGFGVYRVAKQQKASAPVARTPAPASFTPAIAPLMPQAPSPTREYVSPEQQVVIDASELQPVSKAPVPVTATPPAPAPAPAPTDPALAQNAMLSTVYSAPFTPKQTIATTYMRSTSSLFMGS